VAIGGDSYLRCLFLEIVYCLLEEQEVIGIVFLILQFLEDLLLPLDAVRWLSAEKESERFVIDTVLECSEAVNVEVCGGDGYFRERLDLSA
jgi:hypothetical protein